MVFEQDLVPSALKTETTAQGKAVENADWHLDQGDRAADAGNVKSALEHYQKALALEPRNLVAQEKCNEMKKKIASADRNVKFDEYLKKADANYEKNNVKIRIFVPDRSIAHVPRRQGGRQGPPGHDGQRISPGASGDLEGKRQ